MAECKGQVQVTIDGRTHQAVGWQLLCPRDADCGNKTCEERQGKTYQVPNPDKPTEMMTLSETWCSCDKNEPETCHIVLVKNLTDQKRPGKVICRGTCGDKKEKEKDKKKCRPPRLVSETTTHVYKMKETENGGEIDLSEKPAVLVVQIYECPCA